MNKVEAPAMPRVPKLRTDDARAETATTPTASESPTTPSAKTEPDGDRQAELPMTAAGKTVPAITKRGVADRWIDVASIANGTALPEDDTSAGRVLVWTVPVVSTTTDGPIATMLARGAFAVDVPTWPGAVREPAETTPATGDEVPMPPWTADGEDIPSDDLARSIKQMLPSIPVVVICPPGGQSYPDADFRVDSFQPAKLLETLRGLKPKESDEITKRDEDLSRERRS